MATKRKGKPAGTAAARKPAKPAKAAAKPAKPAKPAKQAPAPKLVKQPALPPAPPLPPPPPPPRDEMHAPRDIGRLTRYGERFGGWKIDTRFVQQIQLPVGSGAIAVCDPAAPKSWRVLDRPAGNGAFRVMLSVARDDAGKERLAAITIHVGRPPIAKWTVAHYSGGKKPKSADQLPRCPVTSGWLALVDAASGTPGPIATPADGNPTLPIDIPLTDGRHALALACGNGDYVAYWAVDAADKPVALVVDFEVFTQKEWKARPPAMA